MSALLEVRRLGKNFGGLAALEEIDLDVRSGEILGVIGPNGAGKTTLLNCISGTLRPDRGSVTLSGRRIDTLRPHRIAEFGLGRTLQLAEHFKEFSVVDFVMLGRQRFLPNSVLTCGLHLPAAARREREQLSVTLQLLERYGLAEQATVPLRELPYGTQRLVDMVRAVAAEPKLILLDEPTSGTSQYERQVLRGHLRHLHDEGVTVVVVDHDVSLVADTCDRVLAMAVGRPIRFGSTDEVLADARVVESYLGRPVARPDVAYIGPTLPDHDSDLKRKDNP